MHNDDYFVMIFPDKILNENPSVEGFLNPEEKFKNKSNRKVYIYMNESPIPHCHVLGFKSEICVRLDRAEYFSHDSKTGMFNSKERRAFVEFMSGKTKMGTQRWAWLVDAWNGCAQDSVNMEEITTTTMPDYFKLSVED